VVVGAGLADIELNQSENFYPNPPLQLLGVVGAGLADIELNQSENFYPNPPLQLLGVVGAGLAEIELNQLENFYPNPPLLPLPITHDEPCHFTILLNLGFQGIQRVKFGFGAQEVSQVNREGLTV
jgi:hypothetical protein